MRVWCSVLAVVVCIVLAPGLSRAETVAYTHLDVFSDIQSTGYADALTFLAGFGIYVGDDGLGGAARPHDPITRSEFTAVVSRMLGKEPLAQAVGDLCPGFEDSIPAWAWGYVNYMVSKGLIRGYPDNTFRPENPVTHAEAAAILLRLLGLEEAAIGPWPLNYVALAYEVGLAEGIDLLVEATATRGEIAHLVYNAMVCVDSVWDKRQGTITEGFEMVRRYGIYDVASGVVVSVDLEDQEITLDNGALEVYDLADTVALVGAETPDIKGFHVNVYLRKDGREWFGRAIETVKEARHERGLFFRLAWRGARCYLEFSDGRLVPYDPAHLPILVINGEERAFITQGAFEGALAPFIVEDSEDAFLDMEIRLCWDDKYADHIEAIEWNLRDAVLGDMGEAITWREPGFDMDELMVSVFGEEHSILVDDDTVILLNGEKVSLKALGKNDVLKAALDEQGVGVRIEVTRRTISGEVYSIIFRDDEVYAKIRKANASLEGIRLHHSLRIPGSGMKVKYGLNDDQMAVLSLGTTPRPFLVLRGKYRENDKYHFMVDNGGESVTYEVIGNGDNAEILYKGCCKGSVIHVREEDWDGYRIKGFDILYDPRLSGDGGWNFRDARACFPLGVYESFMATVTVAGDALVVLDGGDHITQEDFVVYQEETETDEYGRKNGNGRVGPYIGGNGLKKKDEVWLVTTPAGVGFILKPCKSPPGGGSVYGLEVCYEDDNLLREKKGTDGEIVGWVSITLTGDTFTGAKDEDLVCENKVMVTNVPAGLTAVVNKISDDLVQLTLKGKAERHGAEDSINDLTVEFMEGAFAKSRREWVAGYIKRDIPVTFFD